MQKMSIASCICEHYFSYCLIFTDIIIQVSWEKSVNMENCLSFFKGRVVKVSGIINYIILKKKKWTGMAQWSLETFLQAVVDKCQAM